MSEDRRVLIEEKYVPEEERLLGGKTTSMLANGSIQKDVKIPFCDFCGKKLLEGEKLVLCSSCQRKICSSCVIVHESKSYCRECAKQAISLTKQHFIVLFGTVNEVDLKNIKKFSCISSEDLRESLATLIERGLIERKGISVFTHYAATAKGFSVIQTCEQIYQNEGDAQRFMMKIQEFLGEKRK